MATARNGKVERITGILETAGSLIVKIIRFRHTGIKSTIRGYGHALQSQCIPPGKIGHLAKNPAHPAGSQRLLAFKRQGACQYEGTSVLFYNLLIFVTDVSVVLPILERRVI